MTVMGMGMVLWEWEGMGTEIVLPAHLYCRDVVIVIIIIIINLLG